MKNVIACLAGLLAIAVVAPSARADSLMPAREQNAVVQKYCAVCHSDAHPNGGISLQHFDAAHADPGVAAMIASKLIAGAMGAAGIPEPPKATIDALYEAMKAEAAGADRWTIAHDEGSSRLTASVVRQLPSTMLAGTTDFYRLVLTCDAATRAGTMQLAWSPATPKAGTEMSASADGQAARVYRIDGLEKMGNGAKGTSAPGSIVLAGLQLPQRSLTIANVFPKETVEFSFDDLAASTRGALAACVAAPAAAH